MKNKTRQELLEENKQLHEKIMDLTLLLESVTGHSDGMEEDLLKKIDHTIRDSEKRFRLITETIPVPIIITQQSDNSITYANKLAGTFFGLSLNKLIKRKIESFFFRQDRKKLADILKKNGSVNNFDLAGKKEDETMFWVSISIQPLTFNGLPCLLSVLFDRTEKIMLEKQLRQAQKMEAVGTLAGGIAHDINNIMSIILGNIELAEAFLPEGSKAEERLEIAVKAVTRAKGIVMQLLVFCRQPEQEKKPLKIYAAIKEAVRMINSFKPSNIQIEENYKSSSPMVLSDPVRIHQIILNLCNNSINALKEKGGDIEVILDLLDPEETFVSARGLESGDYVRLSVIDNGPGISEDIIERIFDPFFTTKEIGHGSGLGLSVVHEIVKRSGGAVSVESEPGKKTAFHIILPIAAGVEDNDNPSIIEKIQQGNERILFVDDDLDLLETYGEMLGIFGYEVEMQNNSINALDLFRAQPYQYDLVITDNMMPGMTGMELIEKIGNIRQDIPIILCSASNEKVDRKKAIAAGGKAFLMKPFSQNEITDLIRNVLGK